MRLRTHFAAMLSARVDHRVPGRDRRERALQHDQRAEERAPLGGHGDAVVEHQPEHGVEHRGVGLRAGREVLRHEARQRALEVVDVDTAAQAARPATPPARRRRRRVGSPRPSGRGTRPAAPGRAGRRRRSRSARGARRPAASRCPGCGSAWNTPSCSICSRKARSSESASFTRSAMRAVAPVDLAHAGAVEPLHHEHARRAQLVVDVRARGCARRRASSTRWSARCGLRSGSRAPRAGGPRTRRPGRRRGTRAPTMVRDSITWPSSSSTERSTSHRLVDPRPLHLHHHRRAVGQLRAVHLADRRRRERLPVEARGTRR